MPRPLAATVAASALPLAGLLFRDCRGTDRRMPAALLQPHGEDRPPTRPALHRDGSTVGLGDPLGDGQPQAGPRAIAGARARGVGPPEALEDVGQIAGGNADAGVGDGEGHVVLVLPEPKSHRAALSGVLD